MKRMISNGRKKVNQLHSIISNRNINLSAQRLLLLSVLAQSIAVKFGSVIKVRQVPRNLFSWGGGDKKGFVDAHLRFIMRQLEGTWV